ncbi:LysM peptidoglycan-binding domain-containing protein [Hyphomicrobium sp. LHD-15]|uniref:LysM peptidoglycan-binding domain-containing protein n=1 Tax=Hyphomicrobium sp. LHD-15 TaxID=3072142 RepID=UPI00280DC250|nr:LysM peptidoglycan-binding domain-containing protein [Hyphomicrobium sp. LHD-15]MDQ8697476.1 LysM peptidoglycan-binding domain-containing protein [Hyphomicrobium sp. LHD-15]
MSVLRQKRQAAATAALCAASLLITAGSIPAFAAGNDQPATPDVQAAPANQTHPLPAVTDWLERAARSYRSDIADKLSVPRETVPGAEQPADASSEGVWKALEISARAALNYTAFWIDRAYRAAGIEPQNAKSYALLAPTSGDQAALDAKAFVEARQKAEAEWKEAVERANAAAAAAAREAKRAGATGGDSPAEAERKRAVARKAELEKIKQELDRKIAEGLAKLEALDNATKARKAEEARKDPAKAQADDAARKAEEARKETEAKRRAAAEEAERVAVARAEEARKVAEAEVARKAEAERKAAEEKRLAEAKAAEEKRIAAVEAERVEKARAEEARKAAEAEAARKAEAERKAAEEKRLAEAKAAEEKRIAVAEAERVEKARAEEARKAAEAKAAETKRFAEARATDATRLVEAAAAARKKAEAERKAAAEKYQAEIKAAEQQRVAAAAPPATEAAPNAAKAKPTAPEPVPSSAAEIAPPAQQKARVAEVSPADATPRARPQRNRIELRANQASNKAAIRQARREAAAHRKDKWKKQRARGYRVHVVKRGETLWSISRRVLKDGARYTEIWNANPKKLRNPNRIYPGQRLRVPR